MGGQFNKDPYFNPKRARAILTCVLLMHIGVIAVPLIYSSLTDYFDPPLIVMKVGLADLPLGDSPDAGAPADAVSAQTSEPEPVTELPPDPQKVDDLPPDIPPPTPKVENPPPKQKTDTKVPVEEPPPKTKTDTKTNVKPPKSDPPKTQTKQDPKPKTLLDSKQINVTQNTKTQAEIDAERKAREAAEARAKAAAQARQQALADARSAAAGAVQGRFGTTNPGQEGVLASKEMRAYYEQLNIFIRPKWNAVSPSSVELSGKVTNWPVINLTIAKDGRITNAVVAKKSGNKAIDAAVDALLATLRSAVAPAPPQTAVIPVTLDIR